MHNPLLYTVYSIHNCWESNFMICYFSKIQQLKLSHCTLPEEAVVWRTSTIRLLWLKLFPSMVSYFTLFGLTRVRKVGIPRGRLFPSGLCLSTIISRVVWAWPDPLPKNVQTLWWAELDRLHSMTRAHPPLALY